MTLNRRIQEDDILVRTVGVHGHFLAREIMVDEEAIASVYRSFLGQCGANAHHHRADNLAAC
jgi:hypothetical protein